MAEKVATSGFLISYLLGPLSKEKFLRAKFLLHKNFQYFESSKNLILSQIWTQNFILSILYYHFQLIIFEPNPLEDGGALIVCPPMVWYGYLVQLLKSPCKGLSSMKASFSWIFLQFLLFTAIFETHILKITSNT